LATLLLLAIPLAHCLAGLLLISGPQSDSLRWRSALLSVSIATGLSIALLIGSLGQFPWLLDRQQTLDALPGFSLALKAQPIGLSLAASVSIAAASTVAAEAFSGASVRERVRLLGAGMLLVAAVCGTLEAGTLATMVVAWAIGTLTAVAAALVEGEAWWATRLALGGTLSTFTLFGVSIAVVAGSNEGPVSLGKIAALGWLGVAALAFFLALGVWGLPWRGRLRSGGHQTEKDHEWLWLSLVSSAPIVYVVAIVLGTDGAVWSNWQFVLLLAALVLVSAGAVEQLAQPDRSCWLRGALRAEIGWALASVAIAQPLGLLAAALGMVNLCLCGSLATRQVPSLDGDWSPSENQISGPWRWLTLGFAMLSLGGVPPLLGFAARWLLLTAAMSSGLVWFTLVALVLMALPPLSVTRQLRHRGNWEAPAQAAEPRINAVNLVLSLPVAIASLAGLVLLSTSSGVVINLALQAVGRQQSSLELATPAWLILLCVVIASLASGVVGWGDESRHRLQMALTKWQRRLASEKGWRREAAALLTLVADGIGVAEDVGQRHYLAILILAGTVVIVYCLGY